MEQIVNVEAERALLGSLMFVPEDVAQAMEIVKPESFAFVAHQRIYETLVHLYTSGRSSESLAMEEALTSRYGESYAEDVSYCMSTSGINTPIKDLIEIVMRHALRRTLIRTGEKLAKAGLDSTMTSDQATKMLDWQLNEVLSEVYSMSPSDTKTMPETTLDFLDVIDRAVSGEMPDIIPTGIAYLDEMFDGGWSRGSLSFYFARPGEGKTMAATSSAIEAAKAGYRVLYFSLEMTTQEMMTRMSSRMSRMPFALKPYYLRTMDDPLPMPVKEIYSHSPAYQQTGQMANTRREAISIAAGCLSELPILINDRSSQNMATIRAASKRFQPDLIIVDHAMLLDGANDLKQMAEYAVGFKALAKDTDAACLIVTQAVREADNRDKLTLRDMYWAGEREAQRVVAFRLKSKEDVYIDTSIDGLEVNALQMWILKNRDGAPDGSALLPISLSTGTIFAHKLINPAELD